MAYFKTIVLDLDETLIYSPFDQHNLVNPNCEKKLEHVILEVNGWTKEESKCYKRPYLDVFFENIFANFKVIVWTAASEDYANEVIAKIKMPKPAKIFSAEKTRECYQKTGKDKLLSFIEDECDQNALIIDDRQDVYDDQPGNAYKIKNFRASDKDAINDIELLGIIKWLKINND